MRKNIFSIFDIFNNLNVIWECSMDPISFTSYDVTNKLLIKKNVPNGKRNGSVERKCEIVNIKRKSM